MEDFRPNTNISIKKESIGRVLDIMRYKNKKPSLGSKVRKLKKAGKSLIEISRIIEMSYEKLLAFEAKAEAKREGKRKSPSHQQLNEMYQAFKKNPKKTCVSFYKEFIGESDNDLTNAEFLKIFLTYIRKQEKSNLSFTDYKNIFSQQIKDQNTVL